MLLRIAFRALQSASLPVRCSLLHQQTMAYFKTPYLFVKSNRLSQYFMEKKTEDEPRQIEKIAEKLADNLAAQAQKGQEANYALMLGMFYKQLDALTERKFPGPINVESQLERQEFKEHLKVFFLLQIKHNESHPNYACLKTFRKYLRKRQHEIAYKIVQLITNEDNIFEKDQHLNIRKILLQKLNSDEFKDYPKELVDEFRRLFDFDMPFAIDNQVWQNRLGQNKNSFITFCPTFTVTSQIFQMVRRKRCFIIGSNSIGKSYSELLLYYLKKYYYYQTIFYVGNILKCNDNSFLAKQLFESCWESLSLNDIDTLSEIYSRKRNNQENEKDEQQFLKILNIFYRNTPSIILIDQCEYLTRDQLQVEIEKKRFSRLIEAARDSHCMFSFSFGLKNQDFTDKVRHLLNESQQQCCWLLFSNNISNKCDLWATLEFEMEKKLRNSQRQMQREQIFKHLETFMHDKDIKNAIEELISDRRKLNFAEIAFLVQWLLKNNKQTIQNFNSTSFALELRDDLVSDSLQRLFKLTVEWANRAKQQQQFEKRVKYILNILKKGEIILPQKWDTISLHFPQDFPNHLLQKQFYFVKGDIVKVVRGHITKFRDMFLTEVTTLDKKLSALIGYFNVGSEKGIEEAIKSLIEVACAKGNMEMKNLIITAFNLEGPINLRKEISNNNHNIFNFKNLIHQCLKPINQQKMLFSNIRHYYYQAGDYAFMLNKKNGPLVVIFMQSCFKKDKNRLSKLLARIDLELYPDLKRNVPKDIKIELKVWMITQHPQLVNDFLTLQAFEERDYQQIKTLAKEVLFDEMKEHYQKSMITCGDIVNQHQIEVKITDLQSIFKLLSADLYKAAVEHREKKETNEENLKLDL